MIIFSRVNAGDDSTNMVLHEIVILIIHIIWNVVLFIEPCNEMLPKFTVLSSL